MYDLSDAVDGKNAQVADEENVGTPSTMNCCSYNQDNTYWSYQMLNCWLRHWIQDICAH